jgi:hypothetical protein
MTVSRFSSSLYTHISDARHGGCIYRGDRWRDLQPPFTHHHKEMMARGIINQRHHLAPIDHAAANHAIDKRPTSLINRVLDQCPSSPLGSSAAGYSVLELPGQ